MIKWIVTSSILIAVIIVLRYILKGKISLRLQYALWGLVLLRLLIPFSIGSSGFSVMNTVQKVPIVQDFESVRDFGNIWNTESGSVEGYPSYELMPETPVTVAENKTEAEFTRMEKALAFHEAFIRIWLCGAAILFIAFAASNVRFSFRLRRTRKPLEVKGSAFTVYISDETDTPCLFGLLRPVIYLTPDAAENATILRHTVEHETTHFRHGDNFWSILRGVCLVLHWYNPLVWWAAFLSRNDAELACDEATIHRIGEAERAEYGRTLIGMTCQKRTALLITATTMTGSKSSIKERITLIAKKPKLLIPAVIAVVLVAFVAVGCTFTGAKTDDNAETIPLTADELEVYNKAFEPLLYDDQGNAISVNPISQFLTSYYDRPEDINLAELLRYFPSDGTVTDKTEFEALKDSKNWPFGADMTLGGMPVPIHKFSADTVNKALKKYMGITLDDLSDVGMDELIYLKDYHAYYNFTSDAGFGSFACMSGERQGDIVRLFDKTAMLTLKIQGDGFLIVSHQLTGEVTGGNSDGAGIGIVADGVDVPDAVLASAKAQVSEYFKTAYADQPDCKYVNWHIELLDRTYTYEDLGGLTLNIYRLNYEFQSEAPENVVLSGGMYITDNNWVCPTYPNCTYLIFNADDGFFFSAVMENDCEPGDEIFTADLSSMQLSESALKAAEVGDAIASVDIDKDGKDEHFYLDKTQMDSGPWVTLRVYNDSGYEIWSEDAGLPHVGWNSLFLCELDGENYLLHYNPSMFQGNCMYTYTLFTLEGGTETVYQTNTLEFDINGTKALDAQGMVAFSDEVNALLEKSTLLLSSEGGTYSFGPVSAAGFMEEFSWLDEDPNLKLLYSPGDDLQTKLEKYSEYAIRERALSDEQVNDG